MSLSLAQGAWCETLLSPEQVFPAMALQDRVALRLRMAAVGAKQDAIRPILKRQKLQRWLRAQKRNQIPLVCDSAWPPGWKYGATARLKA